MKTTHARPWTLLICMWFVCAQALAFAATDAERDRLATQEGEALQLMTRLDRLAAVHGTFMQLRDHEFHGENGLQVQGEQWYRNAAQWLLGLHKVLATVEAAMGRLNTEAVRGELLKEIREQQASWQTLAREADAIRGRAANARTKLAALDLPPAEFVEEAEDVLVYFRQQVEVVSEGFGQFVTEFDQARLAMLQAVLGPTVESVEAMLLQALLHAPELTREVTRIQGVMHADMLIMPLRRDIEASYNQFSEHLAALRIFKAEAEAEALNGKISKAREDIFAMHLDPEYYRTPLAEIVAEGVEAYRRLQDTLRFMNKRDLVASNFATQSVLLAADCRNPAKRSRIDCERLRQLVILPSEAFDDMDDEQLRFVENEIFKAVRANNETGAAP